MLPTSPTTPTRLLDTSVFVDHLRDRNKAATALILEAIRGEHYAAFSVLTDAELWAWGGIKTKQDEKTHRLLLNKLRRLPFTVVIARRAGEIRRKHGVLIPDAIIAATAEYYSLTLHTHNPKHFQIIETIEVVPY